MSVTVIAQVVSILIIAGWLVYKEVREANKVKKYDLMANPERCKDHEERLRSIERSCSTMTVSLAVLETRVGGVERRLDNIAELFAAGGERSV